MAESLRARAASPAVAATTVSYRVSAASDLSHTTAAAANEVGGARQARLDKLAGEKKEAAAARRTSNGVSRLRVPSPYEIYVTFRMRRLHVDNIYMCARHIC